MMRALTLIAGALLLVACTEKPQTAGGVRGDSAPFQGTGTPYSVQGWKQGDKASWEQQLKTRTQNQNDYTRVN